MDVVYERVGCFHGNQLACLHYQPHNNRIQNKTTTTLHAFKIHHKLSAVSNVNNACPYPEPALTHLSAHNTLLVGQCGVRIVTYSSVVKLWFTLRASASAAAPDSPIPFPRRLWKRGLQNSASSENQLMGQSVTFNIDLTTSQ